MNQNGFRIKVPMKINQKILSQFDFEHPENERKKKNNHDFHNEKNVDWYHQQNVKFKDRTASNKSFK